MSWDNVMTQSQPDLDQVQTPDLRKEKICEKREEEV